jgi:L-ascorbate metabolism protein UlaG (beta-lactamase superfamily)
MTTPGGTGDPNVAIRWLGQAGFLIEPPTGPRIAFDPYLSDECERIHGLRRIHPAPVAPADLAADVVLVSHWHEDHLDLPTVEAVLGRGGTLVAPPSVLARVRGALGDTGTLVVASTGDRIPLEGATITVVPAEHRVPGYLTEDAVGYVADVGGITVYHSGDTEYSRSIADALPDRIDVALVCVNGSGGNMNTIEAAALAAQIDASTFVPMHTGMWAPEAYGSGATLDPAAFATACRGLGVIADIALPSIEHPLLVAPQGSTS